jgi:hypothetical protein
LGLLATFSDSLDPQAEMAIMNNPSAINLVPFLIRVFLMRD